MNKLSITSNIPSNWEQQKEYAQMVCKTDFCPKDFKGSWEKVLVAMQFGVELGLHPLQALQNIAVINGRPSLWGDAVMALIRSHPEFEDVNEKIEGEGENLTAYCTIKRRGQTPVTGKFSIGDAKKAGLLGKDVWVKYQSRMLQNRARGFATRDGWQDVLKGLYVREEAEDIPVEKEINSPQYDRIPNNPQLLSGVSLNQEIPSKEDSWGKLCERASFGIEELRLVWSSLPAEVKHDIRTNKNEEWEALKELAIENDTQEDIQENCLIAPLASENLEEHAEWLDDNDEKN